MPTRVPFQRMEFYRENLDSLILSRDGITVSPREGETLALGPETFRVKSVSHNLDYQGSDHEVWRTNVILTGLHKKEPEI